METQAPTKQDIQAKIDAFKAQRAELENKLPMLSNQAALAMVAGENTTKLDSERHKIAEDVRHLSDMIAALEQSLLDNAKNEDVAKLEKVLSTLETTKPQILKARQRLEAARHELKEATVAEKALDETRTGARRVQSAYRDILKKKHKLTDIEISQIEAKFRL